MFLLCHILFKMYLIAIIINNLSYNFNKFVVPYRENHVYFLILCLHSSRLVYLSVFESFKFL